MHTRNCSYDTHARWLKRLARLPWFCDLHSNPSSIISGFMDKSAAAQTFLMAISVVFVSYGIYIDQGRVMHKFTLCEFGTYILACLCFMNLHAAFNL